jgi:uncharacterized membrane protein YkgB
MNKIGILGIIILTAGILMLISFDADHIDLFAGLLTGAGVGLAFTGSIRKRK